APLLPLLRSLTPRRRREPAGAAAVVAAPAPAPEGAPRRRPSHAAGPTAFRPNRQSGAGPGGGGRPHRVGRTVAFRDDQRLPLGPDEGRPPLRTGEPGQGRGQLGPARPR